MRYFITTVLAGVIQAVTHVVVVACQGCITWSETDGTVLLTTTTGTLTALLVTTIMTVLSTIGILFTVDRIIK